MAINLRKTIRMPKKLLADWLKALRSGKYRQGKGKLGDVEKGFCCLGLLEHVSSTEVKDNSELALPSSSWMKEAGVEFTFVLKDGRRLKEHGAPALCVRQGVSACAASCNDDFEMTFPEIADLVEKRAIGY